MPPSRFRANRITMGKLTAVVQGAGGRNLDEPTHDDSNPAVCSTPESDHSARGSPDWRPTRRSYPPTWVLLQREQLSIGFARMRWYCAGKNDLMRLPQIIQPAIGPWYKLVNTGVTAIR